MEEGWRGRYEAAEAGRKHIAELEKKDGKSPKDWLLLGELEEDLVSAEAALQSYRAAVKWAPHLAPGHFAIGRLLCGQGDEAGIAAMEQAIRFDKGYGLWGCDWVISCLERIKAPRDRLRLWQTKRDEFVILENNAWDELFQTSYAEGAMPHGLEREQLRHTITALINDRRVRGAWLLAKKIRTLPDRVYYLLLVDEVKEGRALAESLAGEVRLPGHFMVLPREAGGWSPSDVEDYAGRAIYRRR